jgi:cytochrome subunit of sulfide dehydrogenase
MTFKNPKENTVFKHFSVVSLAVASFAVAAQTSSTAPPDAAKQLLPAAVATTTNPAYLASSCTNCHGTQGKAANGMPSLAGLKADYIVEQMKAFRDGKRQATIMHQLSKGYTDEQIAAMAQYFSTQKAN